MLVMYTHKVAGISSAFIVLLLFSVTAQAQLTITKLDGPPDATDVVLSQTTQNNGGNTRFRFYPAAQREFTGPIGGESFEKVIRSEPNAFRELPNAHRFSSRDRDLGQVFTMPENLTSPVRLKAITLRVGPMHDANEGGANGAKVALQIFEVTGTPQINDSGTSGNDKARWTTFRPSFAYTDDYVEGVIFKTIAVLRDGTLPETIVTDEYMRWELVGDPSVVLEPGKRYAWMVMFHEPGIKRGLALANNNTVAESSPVPYGPMPGGWAIRRCGRTTQFDHVMFDPARLEDIERGRLAASFPKELEERFQISPGTVGYPDVDTYRDFVFWIHATPITHSHTDSAAPQP